MKRTFAKLPLIASLAAATSLVLREPVAAARPFFPPKYPLVLLHRAPVAAPVKTQPAARVAVKKSCPKTLLAFSVKHKPQLNRDFRSLRSHANRSPRAREWAERNRFVDSELAADFAVDATVTDVLQTENEPLRVALDAPADAATDYSQREVSEAQVDVELALGFTYPDEQRYYEKAGLFEKNDFTEIREAFASYKDETFLKAPEKAQSKLPTLVTGKEKKAVAKVESALSKPKLRGQLASRNWLAKSQRPVTLPAWSAVEPTPPPVATVAPPPTLAPVAPVVVASEPMPAPAPMVEVPVELPPFGPEPLPSTKPSTVVALSPKLAAVDPTLHASAATAIPQPRVVTDEKSTQGRRVLFDPTGQAMKEAFNNTPFETDLFGRVEVSPQLATWINEQRAHIELYLQPVGSRDPQGTRYLSYRFPQPEFRDSAKALIGRYELVAGIYRPQDVDGPYAEARFSHEVNAVTAREHLKFYIDLSDLKPLAGHTPGNGRTSTVHLSFFEGASADYREPHPIAGASVRVIGSQDQSQGLTADAQGNLVIAGVATQNDLAIEVTAPGYYRTFRTFRVFNSDVHLPVYLVNIEKVRTMTQALAGVRQAGAAAVLMGRVFDPQTRNPLEGETIELVDHPAERGSYFSFFGEPGRTAATGFFSFFNVAPAFRYISRPESLKPSLRVFMRAESAYYIELGRGGARSFHGRLTDPNLPGGLGNVVGATIRLVGDDRVAVVSGPDGRFEIPGIDFPTGMFALDVEPPHLPGGPQYTLTRHTVAWNPRRAGTLQDLFIVQEPFITQSFASAQASDFGPNPLRPSRNAQTGNLIGGAYGGLLELGQRCLRAELWSVDTGHAVLAQHGPFPFVETPYSVQRPEGLCLTRQNPGFTFQGLGSGEYLLKWVGDAGQTLGGRIVHIGSGRDSIVVN